MKIQEMRSMTLDELRAKLVELEEERFNLRFRLTTQPLDDPLRIRKVRREMARVKTLIREKETTSRVMS
ncbi:MAG TPA: 50S ribosomal protein L29 [Vicinamibacteria bacterium]